MAHHSGQTVLITGAFGPDRRGADGQADRNGTFDLGNFDQLPIRDVPVSALSPGLYLRQDGTNAAHLQLLVSAAGSAELPPILVQQDGWRVIDGLHRLEAAKLRDDHVIKARFLDCTDSEALILALKANSTHGLPLSKADRDAGARRVLTEHQDWSDRAIADITGLSAKTIASLRDRTAGDARPAGKRLGRDGRLRPVHAGEGRRRAAEYLSAHPDAPLRQVARETDVSLGTVHDVSAQLRRGITPRRNEPRVPAPRLSARPAVQAGVQAAVQAGVQAAVEVAEAEAVTAAAAAGTDAVAPMARRRNHADALPTWTAIAAKLANDPTIRYAEGGREFVRWMELHAASPDRWRDLVGSVPAHWIGVLAPIAASISREWSLFAEELTSKQEMAR